MAVLNQGWRRTVTSPEVGRCSTRMARVQRPHPWVGKATASQEDSMGCKAELPPPLSICRQWESLGYSSPVGQAGPCSRGI